MTRRPVLLVLALAVACGPDYNISPSKAGALILVSGNDQSGSAGLALALPIVMKLQDSVGAPRAGVQVLWSTVGNTGSVPKPTDTTNAAGEVSAIWTLGPDIGLQHLIAAVPAVGSVTATALVPGFIPIALTVGNAFGCGLTTTGLAYCWGDNTSGVLAAVTPGSAKPLAIPGGQLFQSISAGADFVCALTTTQGQIWCWGSNSHGQRGVAGTPGSAPTQVIGHTWIGVVAGGQTGCGIASDSTAWCWGINGYGQVGDNSTGTDRFAPVAVTGGHKFLQLALGATHSCGITTAGPAFCWGRNADQELGAGLGNAAYATPQAVASSDSLLFSSVATGGFHTCGVTLTLVTYCWGSEAQGQLGNNKIQVADLAAPTAIDSTLGLTSLAADSASTVAMTAAGHAYWWGNRGSLTSPTSVDRSAVPKLVPGPFVFTFFATGYGVSCARSTNTFTYCWGSSANIYFPASDTPAGVPGP
ncbi:MAG: RCC1 domain-containing protein [Gemmatimonadales bacterium]